MAYSVPICQAGHILFTQTQHIHKDQLHYWIKVFIWLGTFCWHRSSVLIWSCLSNLFIFQKIFWWNCSLNKSLLSDDLICEKTEQETVNYFKTNASCGVSTEIVWDAFKIVLWSHFISMALTCKKDMEKVIADLKSTIASLEAKH